MNKSEVTNCKVFNVLGALVFEDKAANAIGDTKTVDLSAFANGLYFLKLANDTETSTYKIVIEK